MPRPVAIVCWLGLCVPAFAQGGALFDRVADELRDGFYERTFREQRLPAVIAKYRPAAVAAATAAEERAVVHAFLGEVPASHLALYSKATHRSVENELMGRAQPTLGMSLTCLGGRFFVDAVFEDGPAMQAGLRRGDRVLAIDGVAPGASERLDWRADDAWLDDPPVHGLKVAAGDDVAFTVEPVPGQPRQVTVTAVRSSAFAASKASCELVQVGRHAFGYVHLWFVYHDRSAALLRSAVAAFGDCDGVLFDLRGRGGSGTEVFAIVRFLQELQQQGIPMAFLVDHRTRSAKEVLAWEIRKHDLGPLVGERTAGAVVPASFVDVGGDAVLMLPRARLGDYTRVIEGQGVAPHHEVRDRLPYCAGADPIREAGLGVLAEVLAERR